MLPWMLAAALLRAQTQSLPFLSPIFGDHMVLQRGKVNAFWGWTKPHERVTVTIGSDQGEGVSDSSGKWTVRVMPPAGPGPYDVTIQGPEAETLHDVLIGDVWLCGGQSNMEFGLTMAANAKEAVPDADHADIRLYIAPHNWGFEPLKVNQGTWQVCSPETVAQGGWGGFSAVGYFFGLKLERELHVPIGLIEDCWGGTPAEVWTSRATCAALGGFRDDLNIIDSAEAQQVPAQDSSLDLWLAESDPGAAAKPQWQFPDYAPSDWLTVNLPGGFSDLYVGKERALAWFRKEIDLPDPLPSGKAVLGLGPVNYMDNTYINGIEVGNEQWGPYYRDYSIDEGVLRPGRNVIAVRVLASNGDGYVGTKPDDLFLQIGDQKFPLAGKWLGKLAIDLAGAAGPSRFPGAPDLPALLYDGMLCPVAPLAIEGAIWYQGESNADRPGQYRTLLPAMISDWRRLFAQGNFPFYIVSLASYMDRKPAPSDDGWARIRDDQALTAETVPNSGLAITIDVGDPSDIHPKDKETVGNRLALVALAKTYGERVDYSGPVFRRMTATGGEARIDFEFANGLTARTSMNQAFELAGSDRKWFWADARLDGQSVMLTSPQVPHPVAVRYAWQANPPAPLYNGAGLPAAPFRSDRW